LQNKDSELNFSAKGLYNETILTNIFKGNFIDIPFDRDEVEFFLLFDAYIKTFSEDCNSSLPSAKIELTKEVCTSEEVITNGYGMEISRNCVSWKTVGTGVFASPKMYNAKMQLDRLQNADAYRILLSTMGDDDPLGNAQSIVSKAQAAKEDMANLLKMNGCNSKGLERFEENLRLFALNKQPIVLGKNSSVSGNSVANVISKNQNFTKMLEDFVYDHSQKWVMNRYERGSVSNLSIVSKDAQGFPSLIKASYVFQGFTGRTVGTVTLTFKEGLPDCMYFFDMPNNCRTPDRKIVADYAKGAYQN
jgi:hypothetical protein